MPGWLNILIRVLVAIIILVLAYAFKKHIARALVKLVIRFSNERNKENIEEHKEELVKPVGWIIFFLITLLVNNFLVFSPSLLNVFNKIIHTGLLISIAGALAVVTDIIMANLIKIDIEKNKDNEEGDRRTALSYVANILKGVIWVFAAFLVLEQWLGSNAKSLVTGLGIGGIVFALAAQDTASNLVAGLSIMLDKSFDVGDWIENDSGEVAGTVEKIGIRSTKIRAMDGSLVTIPNSQLGSNVVVNGTKRPIRYIENRIPLSASTAADALSTFETKVQDILDKDEGVEGKGHVYLMDFKRDCYEFELQYNTSADYNTSLETRNRVNSKILDVIDEMDLNLANASLIKK